MSLIDPFLSSQRRASGADLAGMARLLAGCLAAPDAAGLPAALVQHLERLLPQLVGAGLCHVAIDASGAPVAMAGWSWSGPGGGASPIHMAHLRLLAVAPGWRGRGIGRALLASVTEEARLYGARVLDCHALPGAEPALGRLGFAPLAQVPVTLCKGAPLGLLRMRKRV